METLTEIGSRCKTDKATSHSFTKIYEEYYGPLRDKKVRLLEIGVFKGASLRMWHDYFHKGLIYGMDDGSIGLGVTVESLKAVENDRITVFIGDQRNRTHLKKFVGEHGSDFDIMVDDGLHYQEHQQVSLGYLFPHVKSGGLYVIEDLCLPNRTQEGWGLKDFKNFSDNTTKILDDFKGIKKIVSPYMNEEEMTYLNEHILEINIYKIEDERDMIAFIRKR